MSAELVVRGFNLHNLLSANEWSINDYVGALLIASAT